MGFVCQTAPFVGNCSAWTTLGNDLDTCSTPTPTERKKRRIRRYLANLAPGSVVLFEDETTVVLFPPLRAAWARRGQQAEVHLSGRNAKRVVYGVLNPRTGHRLFLPRMRPRSVDFQVFLRLIRQRYSHQPIVLLLDADSSHTAKASQRLAVTLKIELLWLPTRSPHLNPVEHLWREGKQKICANRQYIDMDHEVEAFTAYLARLTPREALRKAGVLSKAFWLKFLVGSYF